MSTGRGLAFVVVTAFAGVTLGCGAMRTAPAASRLPPQHPGGGLEAVVASDGTTSVATIDGDELRGIRAAQVEETLEGRVAGVQVIRHAGGGISIRIRGATSFIGGTEPLYIVDGMPVQADPGRGLDWLNPGDVQRIEILKDAAATSIYGVRGANGVVVITTRRPARSSEGRR